MFKKNSIFIRVLIPVITVVLLQTLIISMALFLNGTIGSLKDSSIEAMRKNSENRVITLENMMILYWSNLEKLELDVTGEIDKYLWKNSVQIGDVIGDYAHKKNLLNDISIPLLSSLRRGSATGAFIYFLDGNGYSETTHICNGLYYRDFDPTSTPADYSDILFMRGFIDIARKDKIQLDSLWAELFEFSPDYPDTWRGFALPQIAAASYPNASPVDLSYWNSPHFVNPKSQSDSNECITYTRPLFYQGQLIAMLGVEIQTRQLEKYMPPNDFDSTGRSGYMLVEYESGAQSDSKLDCRVLMYTGGYMARITGSKEDITLAPAQRSGVYTVASGDVEGTQVVLRPLRIYNSNAPFSGRQWALAAVGTDAMLFETADNVSRGLLYSSAFALVIGGVLLAIIIRLSTKPLILIAEQIERSDPDDPIVVSKSNTYEIELLCSTLNTMKNRRSMVEAQLREERERYLIALESAADTFLEYDFRQDSFMLYYFSGEAGNSEIRSNVIESFMEKIAAGEVCHGDDAKTLISFIGSNAAEPVEIRAKAALFPHISGGRADGEYYWFLLRASPISDGGAVTKIIGTAKEITGEKLEESARIESLRRDATTGLYNRDYGEWLARTRIAEAEAIGDPVCAIALHVDNFDDFEARYGRVFGGVILMELSRTALAVTGERDVALRLDNDDFLILLYGADRAAAEAKIADIYAGAMALYVGESADLSLSVSVGAALSEDGGQLIQNALKAVRRAHKTGTGSSVFYGDITDNISDYSYQSRPVSVTLDISRDGIVSFVFELFERTSDVSSAVNILLPLIGRMFEMRRVIICSYDADFGTSRVSSQWSANGAPAYNDRVEKIPYSDFVGFEAMLDESGAILLDEKAAANADEGVRRLLCTVPGEQSGVYCCVMHENGVHAGRALFVPESGKEWEPCELHSLYEITKIIAAHLSIEKSNSASRAKSEFLSRMSHEIRTPMNAIIGMTEIAKNYSGDRVRLEDCLGKIDFSAKHLLALINDVLEMSRIESGKMNLEVGAFSLDSFAMGVDTLMRPPTEARDVTLTINNNAGSQAVIGDEYRLRQVLVNLIGNAGKFTNPGGSIIFSIDPVGEPDGEIASFRFSVKDNGAGISPEDQPNIFSAFEQASSSPVSGKRQGTGLGLAISGSIISAMGSKIELDSAPGKGSEFYFTLKLKLCDDEPELPAELVREVEPEAAADILKGKKALLVEDNEINIEIASYLLEDVGLDIDVANNGQEAVDKFFASDVGYYDVIFMDIQMPIMDGLAATRNIRKKVERPDARSVPIIAMTANAFDEDMKKSIESGMNGHIAKPIDSIKLYELLSELLR